MKTLVTKSALAGSLLLLTASYSVIAGPGNGNNGHVTGIAHDGVPGNPHANENATNNEHANTQDAHSNPKFQNYDPANANALPHQDPTGVPIDGGASVLLAAGAAFGLKKLRDHRNKSNDQDPTV